MEKKNMTSLKKKIFIRIVLFPIVYGLFVILPAGTFFYWEAWVYFLVIFFPVLFVVVYFLKKDPALLERRMRQREKEKEQKLIVLISLVFYIAGYVVPGLDHRFHWSDVPVCIVVMADILLFSGYCLVALVFKTNSYASRIIEVDKNQSVISTGPYAYVRHPMYVGVILMYMSTPIALGSYWGVIPFFFVSISIIFRIFNEEKVLKKELPGYNEYCQKTRYRLIPHVW